MFLVLVLLGCLVQNSFGEDNNVCPTFEDYYTVKNNSNCWYDFSADYDVVSNFQKVFFSINIVFSLQPSVIRLNGYPVIEYKVPTKDGYILTMYRIPTKNPNALKFPVYLQHGLVATCAYFIALKKNSLGKVVILIVRSKSLNCKFQLLYQPMPVTTSGSVITEGQNIQRDT